MGIIKRLRKSYEMFFRIKRWLPRYFSSKRRNLYNSVLVAKDLRFFFSSDGTQKLPRSLALPHPVGIVIGRYVDMGENVIIYQNVTIGVKETGTGKQATIGDDVIIYSGAAILGDIEIGDNAIIAANSVVLDDVPSGATVAGAPARVVD